MPDIHPIALACVAVLAALLFGLGLLVSGARLRSGVLVGASTDPDARLNRLIRAHGNTAEYAAMLAVLFLVTGARAPGALALSLIVLATLSRVLFAVGMLTARTLTRPNPVRFVGALGTYLCGLGLVAVLVLGL